MYSHCETRAGASEATCTMPMTRCTTRPISSTAIRFSSRWSGVRSRMISTTSHTALIRHSAVSAIWRGITAGVSSGPELTLETVLRLVDGALVGAGGEVLPAPVADHEGDVGSLAGLDRLGRLAEGGVQDRARGDAGEDPLLLEQLAHAADGVTRADREARVDQRLVVQLGDEALVEVAQAVDQLAVPRLGGDYPDLGLVRPEEAADAHQGAGRAEATDEVGHLGEVGEDLGTGALLVGEGVGVVAVLVEHHPVGVLLGDLLGASYGLVGAAGRGRGDDLGAPHAQQLTPLLRGVLRHHADQPVALELRGHGQRDAGVAAGGLEDRASGAEDAVLLGLLDHLQHRTVLDGAGRVAVLELGPEAYVGGRRQARQTDQRRAADRVEQVVVAGHQPPATAGSTTTWSPSE